VWVAALALTGAGCLLWASQGGRPSQEARPHQQVPAASAGLAQPLVRGAEHQALDPLAAPSPAWQPQGSLAGAALDGDWGLDAQGRLQPSRALRWRFDHILSQVGERDTQAMRAQLQALLQGVKVAPGSLEALLTLWDRYLELQQWRWQVVVDLQRPETWRAALAERQRVRWQLLGPAWAQAFFAEEDRALLSSIEAREAGRQPEPEAIANAPRPLPNAAEREAALQEQWRVWDQRLAASRKVLAQIATAPELSPLQRQQAVQRHMASSYSSSERLRAEAVLGL